MHIVRTCRVDAVEILALDAKSPISLRTSTAHNHVVVLLQIM